MKSTGEVLGIDETYAGALRKGFIGAGIRLPRDGGRVLVSISSEEEVDVGAAPATAASHWAARLSRRRAPTPG